MATVEECVKEIRNANFGLEVRESIASGIEAIHTVVEQAKKESEFAAEMAKQLLTTAELIDKINGEVI